jgi:hypothetical protein
MLQLDEVARVTVPEQPEPVRVTLLPPEQPRETWWHAFGRMFVGLVLIGAALMVAYTSMRANGWFGHALSVDAAAGDIFSTLSVTAEVIALFLPVANRLYAQAGERWSATKGWLMAVVASAVVFFAASGFILVNVGDKTAMREQSMAQTPAVEAAQHALDDAKAARDRECTKDGKAVVGPVCRKREDAVTDRQHELTEAMAKAGVAAAERADPQASALGVSPTKLRMAQAGFLVALCLLAGFLLSHGFGLVFRSR